MNRKIRKEKGIMKILISDSSLLFCYKYEWILLSSSILNLLNFGFAFQAPLALDVKGLV